jgi:uncharacterized SAM-binding protein YcdF (DUF218 family)
MLQDRNGAPLGEWSEAVDRFEAGIELFQARKAPLLILTGGHVPWRPDDRPEGEILRERAVKLGIPESRIMVTGKVGNTDEEAKAVMNLFRNWPPQTCPRPSGYPAPRLDELPLARGDSDSGPSTLRTSLRSDGAKEGGRKATEGGKRDNQQRTTNGQQPTKSVGSGQLTVGGKPSIILVTSAFHMPRAKMLFERQGFEVELFPVDFQNSDRSKTTILSFVPSAQALAKSETAMREGVGVLYYSVIKR